MASASEVAALTARVASLEETNTASVAQINTFYLLFAGALVFLMQAGFAMLSAGSIRQKNVKNILLKSVLDACIGGLTWYFIGYGFAYDADACTGDACAAAGAHKGNGFIGSGSSNFALSGIADWHAGHNNGTDWVAWFFQYAFCAACATIVSGAVAERCQLGAYLVYCIGITGFIYPVVVHWVWDSQGFLSAANPNAMMSGMIDFAGSGVVHMTGGVAAFVGAKVVGPRTGRWERPADFQGHNAAFQVLGTFLLWFGWYGFNPGSTLTIVGDDVARDAARCAVTTTLSGSAGAVMGLLVKRWLPAKFGGSPGVYDLGHTCNSLLAGLVAITAGCQAVHPWAAILIGLMAAWVYHGASCLMRKLKIDDPLDAFAVHGANGFFGCLMVGFFTTKEYTYAKDGAYGAFMGGGGMLLATQFVGCLIQMVWVGSMSLLMFSALKFSGFLRMSIDAEVAGADVSKHGGHAYPEQAVSSDGYPPADKSTTATYPK